MRFYKTSHQYYCGIDLHTKQMYCCIIDSAGSALAHVNLKTEPEAFLSLVKPYREDLVVGAECIFSWYWLADLCLDEGITFVLGHALAMKAIHGGKVKNDKLDSEKIAMLLRGGMLPQAYVYPKEMRATRDLLRDACTSCITEPRHSPISRTPITRTIWTHRPRNCGMLKSRRC